jgi:hypothetical protein
MADRQYRRLTRSKLRSSFALAAASRSSLWLGQDHLLVIDTSGYNETYKRFYFRDIQALTLSLTQRRLVWNWILGVSTAGCLSIWGFFFAANPNPGLTVVGIAFGTILVFALPLLLNNLLGPTCACHLRTAVQTERLCSLNRLRHARKLIERLRPLITAAQGTLPAGESSVPPPASTGAPAQSAAGDVPSPVAAEVREETQS